MFMSRIEKSRAQLAAEIRYLGSDQLKKNIRYLLIFTGTTSYDYYVRSSHFVTDFRCNEADSLVFRNKSCKCVQVLLGLKVSWADR